MRFLPTVLLLLLAMPAQGQPPTLAVSHQARVLQPGEVMLLRIASPEVLMAARVSGLGRDVPAVRVMSAGEAGEI